MSPQRSESAERATLSLGSDAAIREVNPLELPEWDRAVAGLPGATFFHGRAWAQVLGEVYGFSPQYLVAESGGATTGVLPLMEVNSWCTGRRGISLPFTDRCPPAAEDPQTRQQLLTAAIALGRGSGWRYCELRGGGEAIGAPPSISYYQHVIPLGPDPQVAWNRFDGSVRQGVRRAEKSGVQIEFSASPEAVRAFYTLHCRTRQRHGLPPPPRRFFDAIQRHILARGHGQVVLARHDGAAIAGAVYFHFGRTALYKFGASDDRFLPLRPNNLVMWRAVEWYAQHGFESVDLGRTSLTNAGLRRFKQSLGSSEHPIDYTRYDYRRGWFVTSPDQTAGLHTLLFRHLPLPLSRWFGALAYKHVA